MSSTSNSESLDPRVNRALLEYLERTDRGEIVDHREFLADHVEIADQLRSFIFDHEDLARRAAGTPEVAAEVSTNRSLSETIAPQSTGAVPSLPEVFGRYRLQRLLGRGAMGAVYLALDTQLSRPVAIKVPSFSTGQSDELMQRFYFEARAAATLRNPHICPVFDVGDINGQHYITMAYIEGRSLSELIKAKGPQPERQVLLLVRKLALALQEAHNQGVIHRDLKPGNIMIDRQGEPVVMDFGLACQTCEGAARITHSGVILGSPAYMPPEQLEGNSARITPAADQYALGVILYELLTGQLPFRGSISAVISQIVIKPPPSPRVLRPDLDPRVEQLCLQMLAKSPGERLESMKAVADRVVTILREPPQAAVSHDLTRVAAESKPGKSPDDVMPPTVASPIAAATPPVSQTPDSPFAATSDAEQSERMSKLCLLAGKLIRKHDYAQAIEMLSSVPAEMRSEELSDLLSDAEEKEDECRQLLHDIELAIRRNQPQELPALVRRFLQLKPANKAMQSLSQDLRRVGAEEVIRVRRSKRNFLDPAGATWNPTYVAAYLIGLAALCYTVYLGTIVYGTPNGIVIVEVHDPRITVNFANDEITATSSGKQYRLRTTDKKTLQLEIDGVTVDSSTQEVTVAQNETKLISAKLIDGKLDLSINGQKRMFSVPDKDAQIAESSKSVGGPVEPSGQKLASEWIDLLPQIDLAKASGSISQWKREGTILVGTVIPSVKDGFAGVVPELEIHGDYDLELDYRAVETNHVQVGLPLNDTTVTVSIHEACTGLHTIDGKQANPRTASLPHGNPNLHLRTGIIQHMAASVRHQGDFVTVETTLDGADAGRFSGLRSRLTTPTENFPAPDRFKIVSTFQTRTDAHRIEIHKLRVRFVNSSLTAPADSNGEWIDLFNGKDLAGWKGDPSLWSVRDGILAGNAQSLQQPAYLLTKKDYGNFELRLQFKLSNKGNSGVQYRTLQNPAGSSSPVAGHQAEIGFAINPSEKGRGFVGDIYGQGMQSPRVAQAGLAERSVIDALYRHEDWNDLAIHCDGPRERVMLNNIVTAAIDDATAPATGRIGLQLFPKTEIEFRNIRIRELGSTALSPKSVVTPVVAPVVTDKSDTPKSASSVNSAILDVDFRKSDGNFSLGDDHHILAEHKDGEYRYHGKKVGWWYGGLHPEFWRIENNQLSDFSMEVDVRLVGKKKGSFAIEFGQSGDGTLSLCLDQDGKIRLLHYVTEIVPPTASPVMRPVDQFNTLKLVVKNKTVHVMVNGVSLFEKQLERYTGAPICLWLNPEEVPFDVRIQRIRWERIGADTRRLAKEIRRFKGHTAVVRGVAFLGSGQRAVSVGHGKAFKLWDVMTGELLHDFVGHTDHVTGVAVSLDGRRAITGCWDTHVRLWDLENRTLLKTLKGHNDKVVSVVMTRDGQTGLSVSNDGVVRQWDLKTGRSKLIPGPAPYGVLAMNLAENIVATGNGDGSVVLRGPQGVATLSGHLPGYVEGLAFTPDGTRLATGGDDGTLRIWNLQNGKEIHRWQTEGVGIDTVVITNDGRYVIAGSCDQKIVAWDLKDGKIVAEIHADMPVTHRLALSPDNQLVLSGGGDRGWKPTEEFDLRLWQLPKPPAPEQERAAP